MSSLKLLLNAESTFLAASFVFANSTSTQSGAFFFSAYFPAKSIIHVPKDDRSNDLLFL